MSACQQGGDGNRKEGSATGNPFITVKEIAEITQSSERTAYRIVSALHDELKEKGYLTISGKVPRRYFMERTGLEPDLNKEDA